MSCRLATFNSTVSGTAVSVTAEYFGLEFPQPGWAVLDAIRDAGFTGSVLLGGSPAVRVFADQGDIYWAEDLAAPSVGARLVDAGALTAVQLERGAVRHADVERLERLFERVPAIERDAVLVVTRALAEQSLVGIARQTVVSAAAESYAHHTSGIHLWNADQPVARRNDAGRSRWAPPQVPVATPAAVSPAVPLESTPQPLPDPSPPTTPTPTPHDAGPAPLPPAQAPASGAESDDFLLVWNDVQAPTADDARATSPITQAAEVAAPVGALPHDAAAAPTHASPTPDVSPASQPVLADEFEVRWPGGLVEVAPRSAADGAERNEHDRNEHDRSEHDRRERNEHDQHNPRRRTHVDGQADHFGHAVSTVHPEARGALSDALSDLLVLVDRDLASGRRALGRESEMLDRPLSADHLLAVRGAVSSVDTGSLDARRRLVDHRSSDHSSRGSSETLHRSALSDDVDEFGGPDARDELDDLADGSPALRRIMGNLRRA